MARFSLPKELENAVQTSISEYESRQLVERIWQKDHTVWHPEPDEISNRLGWLSSHQAMTDKIDELSDFADAVRRDGVTHTVLLGMGGSSLAPEVFSNIFGARKDYPTLSVLDSTDPQAVLACAARINPGKTLFIVSTKSGGTIETLSFFKYFYNLVEQAVPGGKVGQHFVAITDPGSSLEKTARNLAFRKIFLNDSNIGGRYSVLSYFGLVPSALLGIENMQLLQRAGKMADACRETSIASNPGAWLGLVLGQAARAGRDKMTLLYSPGISHLGSWIEQLVAESTGKNGRGILPVDLEEPGEPDVYGNDRLFIYAYLRGDEDDKISRVDALAAAGHPVIRYELADRSDLGAEFFRWEFATAVASALLQVNPFDQPNVEAAKIQARQMVEAYQSTGELPAQRASLSTDNVDVYGNIRVEDLGEAFDIFFADANTGPGQSSRRSYVAIQAYLPPTSENDRALQSFRRKIRDRLKLATTLGYGPRFLHSTGQLHKGDAGNGLFIQITADSARDAAIPDSAGSDASGISFQVLKMAQALGDRKALLAERRKILAFQLKGDTAAAIDELIEYL